MLKQETEQPLYMSAVQLQIVIVLVYVTKNLTLKIARFLKIHLEIT